MNIGNIAEWLLIRHNSAVELVTRCERNGWVERVRDESDRRAVLVQLTPKGESVLRNLSAVHMQELRTTGPALINTLNRILEQLPTSENS